MACRDQAQRAEIEAILVDKNQGRLSLRQVWFGDVSLPDVPSPKLAQHGPDVILDQRWGPLTSTSAT